MGVEVVGQGGWFGGVPGGFGLMKVVKWWVQAVIDDAFVVQKELGVKGLVHETTGSVVCALVVAGRVAERCQG
ncbi:hypothetical protein [Mycobacteroides abscessus]|uniref:hypothetical protein n=1 Tax=Mycobacteroides abscessus TaxID=36809 RepID=UPI00140332E9|nr:hypothetical protein [Mycobacteroides abscessus]